MKEIFMQTLGSGFFGSILGILIAQYLKNHNNQKQSLQKAQQQMFSTYSERYSKIMSLIVKHYTKVEEESFDFKNSQQRENLTQFFLLFSELFVLHNQSLIEDSSWEIWKKSLSTQMKSLFFSEAWKYVESQIEFSDDFVIYMNHRSLIKEMKFKLVS